MHGEFEWGSMLIMLALLGTMFVVPAVVFVRDYRKAQGRSVAVPAVPARQRSVVEEHEPHEPHGGSVGARRQGGRTVVGGSRRGG